MHRSLRGLDWIALVVDGGRGTGKVVNLVDLDIEREGDVVPQNLESGVTEQMRDVVLGRRVVIVDAEHVIPIAQQALT